MLPSFSCLSSSEGVVEPQVIVISFSDESYPIQEEESDGVKVSEDEDDGGAGDRSATAATCRHSVARLRCQSHDASPLSVKVPSAGRR